MRDKATIIHADGRTTTIEAPLFGSVEVKLGDGVSCITARTMRDQCRWLAATPDTAPADSPATVS